MNLQNLHHYFDKVHRTYSIGVTIIRPNRRRITSMIRLFLIA